MKKNTIIFGSVSLCALVSMTGCSLLVQPDLSRLGRDGGRAGDTGASVVDGVAPTEDVEPTLDVPNVEVDVPNPLCLNGCNDNVACTTDRCNAGNCVNTPDNTFCAPNQRCDATMGCVPNMMMMRCQNPGDCNDRTPCTQDVCDMGTGMCSNPPVDADRDGVPAMRVDGVMCAGLDCDDNRNNVNPMAMEVCGDRIDNNCNGMVDDPAICNVPPMNTTCPNATPINLTMVMQVDVMGDNRMGMDMVSAYCNDGNIGRGPELWYAVTWPANRDLVLEMSRVDGSGSDPALYVTTMCGAGILICNDDIAGSDNGSRVILRAESGAAVGNRTVYVAADGFNNQAGPFRLRSSTRAVVAASCNSPYDLGAGGTVRTASLNPAPGNSLCGPVSAQDFYRVRGNQGQGVFATTQGQVEQRFDCGMAMGNQCRGMSGQFMTRGDTIFGIDRGIGAVGGYYFTVKGP